MTVNKVAYQIIKKDLEAKNVRIVAVSKTKPIAAIKELYDLGQRDFGENYVQELADKAAELPKDINWHYIGHLQTNKVRFIAPFVQLIHAVDSLKLLKEINKQAAKHDRVIACLLQVYIAQEESKFGLNESELDILLNELSTCELKNIKITGLMGMASFTDDMSVVKMEFRRLHDFFNKIAQQQTSNIKLETLSMGMSSDYKIAVEVGSNMVRIGSLFFGERSKK